MTNEEKLKNLIKKQIIINADETKYRYEIGKGVMDNLAEDIVKALKIKELIAENKRLKFKHENNPLTLDEVKELKAGEVVWLKSHEPKYTPTCPRGYTDCVYDPAYIKFNHPEWYKKLYGDKTPEEASYECQELMKKDPNEEYYCYDNEDK